MTKWLSVKQAAEYLAVSKETIYRLLEKQAIPCHRVGKLWRFKPEELDAWVSKPKMEKTGAQTKNLRFIDLSTGEVWYHRPNDWILNYCNFNTPIHPTQLQLGQSITATGEDGGKVAIECILWGET